MCFTYVFLRHEFLETFKILSILSNGIVLCFLWTVYNRAFTILMFWEKKPLYRMRFRLNFAFILTILHFVRLTIHWQSFYITHGMEYSSVCLSERATLNLHPDFRRELKSYERSLEENVGTCGVCKSMKRCLLIAYCLRIIILWVPLFEDRIQGVTVPGKLCNLAY